MRGGLCGCSEGGEDGWSAVGGKRGKPQRNKRPSGLIRRQIGCRARRREESERDIELQGGGEVREKERESERAWEREFNILGRPHVLGPHISPCLHMSIQQAGFLGAPRRCACNHCLQGYGWILLLVFMYFYVVPVGNSGEHRGHTCAA